MDHDSGPLAVEDASFGRLLPRIGVRPPGPRSRELSRRLAQVESRNVTYLAEDFPVFWERAAGANVEDVDGNVYVDLAAAFGVAMAGHADPRVAQAIHAQADRLVHGMGDVHPSEPKIRLMERLAALAPWPKARCVLASSGSEAVEVALKTAELASGRSGLVAFEGAYHGLTLGALGATHRELFRAPFANRLPRGVRFGPWPTREAEVAEALGTLSRLLSDGEAPPVGAVILEPIQGRAGVRVPPPGFVPEVCALARAAGALVVFDEIFTGLGRTGRMFGYEWEGVVPDLLCLGKALGGGLPISACLGSDAVMSAWPLSGGEAIHTSTFLGHPLGCAAALGLLDVLEQDPLIARSLELGNWLRASLVDRLRGNPQVREVRGRGMMIGVELSGRAVDLAGGAPAATRSLLEAGFLALPAGTEGEVLQLTPPLVLTEGQARAAVDAIVVAVAGGVRA